MKNGNRTWRPPFRCSLSLNPTNHLTQVMHNQWLTAFCLCFVLYTFIVSPAAHILAHETVQKSPIIRRPQRITHHASVLMPLTIYLVVSEKMVFHFDALGRSATFLHVYFLCIFALIANLNILFRMRACGVDVDLMHINLHKKPSNLCCVCRVDILMDYIFPVWNLHEPVYPVQWPQYDDE